MKLLQFGGQEFFGLIVLRVHCCQPHELSAANVEEGTTLIELQLHHVSIPVRKLSVSAPFYEKLFELERLQRPDFGIPGVWFACGDRQVHLIENSVGPYRSVPRINVADAHFAFWTSDFERVLKKAKASGFSDSAAEWDPMRILVSRSGLAGFPQFYLLDPDFNIIEVNSAPM